MSRLQVITLVVLLNAFAGVLIDTLAPAYPYAICAALGMTEAFLYALWKGRPYV